LLGCSVVLWWVDLACWKALSALSRSILADPKLQLYWRWFCFVGVSFRHFHLLRYFFRPFKVCFHSRIQYGWHKSSRRFLRDVGCHVAGSKALRSVEPFNSCRSEITTALSCYQRRNRYNIWFCFGQSYISGTFISSNNFGGRCRFDSIAEFSMVDIKVPEGSSVTWGVSDGCSVNLITCVRREICSFFTFLQSNT